jgi:hypothetical protein
LIFCSTSEIVAQSYFSLNSDAKKQTVSFKLLSNLIIFPIEVNGKELNFILDSGVGATILFNLNSKDSLALKNIEKVKLQGLGSEEPIDAILSRNNVFKFKNINGFDQSLYVLFDDSFDLSSKLGITVHGIIGYEILKDFIVQVNYSTKRLSFYNPNNYEYKDCKKCESFELMIHAKKPYITIGAKLNPISDKITPVKLLIDSGGSDALWLFENSLPDINPPKKYFIDFLGEGLSGTIYGKRALIKELIIGQFVFKNPTVSYPDSTAISHARNFKERNGSLGGSILKRFSVIFDYKNQKITFKKGSSFNKPFRYNMSGIELVYYGKILVKEHDKRPTIFSLSDGQNSEQNKIVLDYRYKYTFKPAFKIHKLRVGSPAYRSGLREEDIVIKINGKYTYEMKLEDIVEKFYQKEKTKISLLIERDGKNYTYKFNLENMLK